MEAKPEAAVIVHNGLVAPVGAVEARPTHRTELVQLFCSRFDVCSLDQVNRMLCPRLALLHGRRVGDDILLALVKESMLAFGTVAGLIQAVRALLALRAVLLLPERVVRGTLIGHCLEVVPGRLHACLRAALVRVLNILRLSPLQFVLDCILTIPCL